MQADLRDSPPRIVRDPLVAGMIRRGMTLAEIVQASGVPKTTVGRIAERMGLTIARAGRPAKAIARDAEIARLVAQGLSAAQIEREAGIPDSTVQDAVKRLDLAIVRDNVRLSAETRAQIVEARRNGQPWRDIAAHFGVSNSAISGALAKAGVTA